MSDLYVSFTVRHGDAAAVAAAMTVLGRKGFVAPAVDGFVVAYDAASSDTDTGAITGLATALSDRLGTAILAAMNNEDEALLYWVCERGLVVDTYNSNPGQLHGGDDAPQGGDPEALCRAMADDADRAAISAVLRAGNDEETDYPFAVERHVALCEELGLPADYCCVGHANVAEGSAEDIPGREQFIAL